MVQEGQIPNTDKPTGGVPVPEFRGNLVGWHEVRRVFDGSERLYWSLDFTDIEVIRSVDVYPFPTISIEVSYSDPTRSRGGTRWEVLSDSVRRFSPNEKRDIGGLKGHNLHMSYEDAPIRMMDQETKEWGEVTVPCWKIKAVEGLTGAADSAGSSPEGTDIYQHLANLLDGKTEPQFTEAVFADERCRNRPDLVTKQTNRQLIPEIVAQGLVELTSEGVYKLLAAQPTPPVAGT